MNLHWFFRIITIALLLINLQCDYLDPFSSLKNDDFASYSKPPSFRNVKTIFPDSSAVSNSLPVGKREWYKFPAIANQVYAISVQNSTINGSIMLIGPDSTSSILNNSLYGSSHNFLWKCPSDGNYFLMIRNSNGSSTGGYTLSIYHDSYEPDSTRSLAAEILTNKEQKRIFLPNDHEWIKFSAVKNNYYQLKAGLIRHCRFELYGAEIVTSQNYDYNYGEATLEINWLCPSSGTYYAHLWSNDPYASDSFAYSFNLSMKTNDAHEPDDSTTQATRLIVGGVSDEHILLCGDVDYFSFEAQKDSAYIIRAKGTNQYSLYSSSSISPLAKVASYNSDSGILAWSCPKSGEYFLEFFDNSKDTLPKKYTVSLSPFRNDTFETDNSLLQAHELSINIPNTPHNTIMGDNDWYKFNAHSGCVYQIARTYQSSIVLDLWDSTKIMRSLKYDSWSGDSQFIWACSRTGTYFVNASADSNAFHALPISYTLSITRLVPVNLTSDSIKKSALSIIPDNSQITYQLAPDEQQWFKLSAIAGNSYQIQFTGDTSLYLIFYSQEGLLTGNNEFYGSQYWPRNWQCMQSGDYFIKIVQSSNYSLTGTLSVLSYVDDIYEPDNWTGNAKEILADSKVQSRFIAPYDEDNLYFSGVAGATYTVRLSPNLFWTYATTGLNGGSSTVQYGSTYTSFTISCENNDMYSFRISMKSNYSIGFNYTVSLTRR